MTDLMTDYCHYFFVSHDVHQSGTDTHAAVTTGESVNVHYFIYAKVNFHTIYFFDVSGQSFQAFSVFAVRFGQWVMLVHPFHILLAHSSNVGVR